MRLILNFILLSCNDYSLKNEVKTGPELVVYPENIEFGHLVAGTESGQKVFAVINAGDEDLIISHPELISNNINFNLDHNTQENYTISPGDTQDFNVYYTPETFESGEAIIRLVSNDEDENQHELLVTGFGDAPVMTVTPEDFDYGQISIGCDNEERITIRNDGNLDLYVDNITQMVTQPQDIIMEFGNLPSLPWELLPNQEVDFLVSYTPVDISYDESVIRIEGNDPAVPLKEIAQYGEGDVEHWHTQTYIQEEISLLDVLFVVDNSGSMNIFQQELSNQMISFMNVFDNSGTDYHLATITTDEARFKQYDGYTWIDATHPDPVMWMQNVITSIGIRGSGIERGIEMVKYALEGDAAPGQDYHRENATMVIIYVSDEPDHSQGSWISYTNFFDSFKLSTDLMRQFAVIGDHPSGCNFSFTPYSRNIQFGSGYYEMTQRYNGDWYSICATDWGQQMQNLANTVTTKRSFALNEPDPIETTIIVTVNGQLVSNWSYDIISNSVVFDAQDVPEPGKTINIEYAVWGCGE
jgi:hypothetical protein